MFLSLLYKGIPNSDMVTLVALNSTWLYKKGFHRNKRLLTVQWICMQCFTSWSILLTFDYIFVLFFWFIPRLIDSRGIFCKWLFCLSVQRFLCCINILNIYNNSMMCFSGLSNAPAYCMISFFHKYQYRTLTSQKAELSIYWSIYVPNLNVVMSCG